MRYYHYNVVSHHSKIDSKDYTNYPIFRCSLTVLNDLAEYIRSPWIRPEDIGHYHFIDRFKIVGREKSVDFIFRCLDAYVDGVWNGNLLDIIPLMVKAPIYVENRKLDGFIDWFLKGRCDMNCPSCGYCDRVARDVIKIDEDGLKSCKEKLSDLLRSSLYR
jgi:collagenase-like PrtC family protease